MKIDIIILLLFGLSSQLSLAQNKTIDYFGQTPPMDSAVVFKPDIISTNDNIFSAIFSPTGDELFLIIYNDESNTILHTKLTDSLWAELDTAFFAREKGVETVTISPDGKLLTYTKSNPSADYPSNTDIYYCTHTDTGWSKSKPFPVPINSKFREAGHALTSDRTIYFATGRPTDDKKADIFRARYMNGEYTSAEYIPNLSTPADEDGIWISPDEEYAIVESWQDENKKDFYISFRKKDDTWSELKNMGPKVNTPSFEGTPKVSNDGKYLFFWSDRTGVFCIHWIRVDVIVNDLRKEIFN